MDINRYKLSEREIDEKMEGKKPECPDSDTSDDEEINEIIARSQKPKEAEESTDMDDTTSLFSSAMSKNEIGLNDIEKIQKFFPKLVERSEEVTLFGQVEGAVNQRFVVERLSGDEILDLDNFICDESKNVIGFIEDVIGPVSEPKYVVGLYSDFRQKLADEQIGLQSFIGKQVYYVSRTKKLVFWHNLLQGKGTDASNFHDEEIPASEQDFSDDEDEQQYKKLVKKMRQRKRVREEGEEAKEGAPRDSGKRMKRKEHKTRQFEYQQEPAPTHPRPPAPHHNPYSSNHPY